MRSDVKSILDNLIDVFRDSRKAGKLETYILIHLEAAEKLRDAGNPALGLNILLLPYFTGSVDADKNRELVDLLTSAPVVRSLIGMAGIMGQLKNDHAERN